MNIRRPPILRDRTSILVAAIPIAVVLILLVPVVDVDPIPGVTQSNSPFTDEAWSVLNARNWAMFGSPTTDQWTLWVLSLPFTVIDMFVFRIFGIGIVQARLVDVGCAAITAGLLGVGLRRPFGGAAALVAAIGYATSALVLFYGRMAYFEPMVGMFSTAGTLSLLAVDGPRPGRWGIAGGLAFALAIGTKLTALTSTSAVIVVALLFAVASPAVRRWVVGAASILIVATIAWVAFIWLPNPGAVANVVDHIYPPGTRPTVPGVIRRAISYVTTNNDNALWLLAPLLIGATGGAIWSAAGIRTMSLGARLLVGASAAAFVVGLTTVVLTISAENRYVVFLIPWLAILTAPLAAAILQRVDQVAGSRSERRRRLLATAVVMVVLLAVPGVVAHVSWMRSGTRNLVAAQAEAGRTIRAGSVVAGGYAPLLAMSANATTIVPCCGQRPVNAGDLYADAGARFWADVAAPTWATAHQSAWQAGRSFDCLPWRISRQPLCLRELP